MVSPGKGLDLDRGAGAGAGEAAPGAGVVLQPVAALWRIWGVMRQKAQGAGINGGLWGGVRSGIVLNSLNYPDQPCYNLDQLMPSIKLP